MPFHQKDSVGQRLLVNKQLRSVSDKGHKSNAMFFGDVVTNSDGWRKSTVVKCAITGLRDSTKVMF